MDTFITIVLLIVLLLVLIGFHEAGHFAVAKMCNVYCAEFSLGFGPKLFSFKRKKGETAFTVRLLPLGGYVSMYGEEGELDEDEEELGIPPERSLNGVHKLKKTAILLAGVTMNFLLTFVFCYVYALCFPDYTIIQAPGYDAELTYSEGYLTRTYTSDEEGSLIETPTAVGVLSLEQEETQYFETGEEFAFYAGVVLSNPEEPDEAQIGGYLFDTEVTIGGESYVALFNPTTVTSESNLVDSLTFYKAITVEEAKERSDEYYPGGYGDLADLLTLEDDELLNVGITAYPDFAVDAYELAEGDEVTFHLNTLSRVEYIGEDGSSLYVLDVSTYTKHEITVSVTSDLTLESAGLIIVPTTVWYSFSERWENGTTMWCNLWVNMGAGLYALFTGNISSLSGPIGIGAALGTIAESSGWAYSFFYLGALVSLNLAIINLFPFPGLDGWQLVCTAYEAITKKKISQKVQNIVSYIGLGLLLVLAIYIMASDIVKLLV